MKKPTFIKKLMQLNQHAQSWLLNPESPLFVFKKMHEGEVTDNMLSQNGPIHSKSPQNQSKNNVNHFIFPKSNRLRQELTNPISRLLEEEEKNAKSLTQKYQKRRIKTVPYDTNQKYKILEEEKEIEMKPVLMINQIKPKNSQAQQRGQNSQIDNQIPEIAIKLQDSENLQNDRKILKCETIQSQYMQNQQTIDVKDDSRQISKTNHYFHKSKVRKNKSIFVKQIVFKADETINKKIGDKKLLSLSYTKPFQPPRNVTAKSYIIYRISSNNTTPKMILSQSSKSRQQIASLTKIMTAILTIQICKKFSIDKYAEEVTISSFESKIGGTSACIKKGQIYTIQQLLYGLMLPSGNDASLALATWAGSKLLDESRQTITPKEDVDKRKTQNSEEKLDSFQQMKEKYYKRFIQQMNAKARILKMKKTTYANSHGLSNADNKSCAHDLAILCDYCMQNQTFRTIVRTQKYSGYIRIAKSQVNFQSLSSSSGKRSLVQDLFGRKNSNVSQSLVSLKKIEGINKNLKVEWQNTHDLLKKYPDQYIGIKTGITYTAGPCLSSCFVHRGKQYVIIVLNCESSSMRFRDTQALRKWCVQSQNQKNINFSGIRQKKLTSLTQKIDTTKLSRKS